jgi:DNA-binding Lrp family transcriptional regulator
MDQEDVRLCRMLFMNSRLPYQEMAKKLRMSVPAVHKRLVNLVDQGIISAFTAEVDPITLGARMATVFGRSKLDDISSCVSSLASNDCTWMILLGGNSELFVYAHLRRAEDLPQYARFVIDTAALTDGFQGIHTVRPGTARFIDYTDEKELTPLELAIIRSLSDDARKRMSDVAKEVGATSRMVNRKIISMQKEHKVRFSIRWSPDYGKEIISLVHFNLKEGADVGGSISTLMSEYPDNILFCSAFQESSSILATVWTATMRGIGDIVNGMSESLEAESATPHIIYGGHHFKSWKNR